MVCGTDGTHMETVQVVRGVSAPLGGLQALGWRFPSTATIANGIDTTAPTRHRVRFRVVDDDAGCFA